MDVAIGTASDAVPFDGLVVNFSPMPRIAPPLFGRVTDGSETVVGAEETFPLRRCCADCATPGGIWGVPPGDGGDGFLSMSSGNQKQDEVQPGRCLSKSAVAVLETNTLRASHAFLARDGHFHACALVAHEQSQRREGSPFAVRLFCVREPHRQRLLTDDGVTAAWWFGELAPK